MRIRRVNEWSLYVRNELQEWSNKVNDVDVRIAWEHMKRRKNMEQVQGVWPARICFIGLNMGASLRISED